MSQPLISVIIRTKNEERWIKHCLSAVFAQTWSSFEVIVVDNKSTDGTMKIVQKFPVKRVLTIDKFLPGAALNLGVEASLGAYFCCLSAHCLPATSDWLEQLYNSITSVDGVAGVYGRQMPVSFTQPLDARDLMLLFGRERRVQHQDYFFHNANSIVDRNIFNIIPFDGSATHIEDRIWAKKVIEAGYKIIYEPTAKVFHHHGLHHHNNLIRARGVISVMEELEPAVTDSLPSSMHPSNQLITALIPVPYDVLDGYKKLIFDSLLAQIESSEYLTDVVLIGNQETLAGNSSWTVIDRSVLQEDETMEADELIIRAVESPLIEEKNPDYILYFNWDYLERPKGLIDTLIRKACYGGFDSVFPGIRDFGEYWQDDEDRGYKRITEEMISERRPSPLLKALYGQGTLTRTSVLKRGGFIGEYVGVEELHEVRHTLRYVKGSTG